jgi:DNA-binding transcriptional LysR family regulator
MREPDTRLVRLNDIGLHTEGEFAYYLAYHPKQLRHKPMSAFRDWFLREAAKPQRLT